MRRCGNESNPYHNNKNPPGYLIGEHATVRVYRKPINIQQQNQVQQPAKNGNVKNATTKLKNTIKPKSADATPHFMDTLQERKQLDEIYP